MRIVISSGHGLKVRGASGYIDEVDEARRVVSAVAGFLREQGVGVVEFHDDSSTSQSENLNRIVNFHNSQARDLDVSVHFNAYETTDKPMGTECLYLTQGDLATMVAGAISRAGGFINRGAKYRSDLAFLNGTTEPAILLEICFVDSLADTSLYERCFTEICAAIADALCDGKLDEVEASPLPPGQRFHPDIICTVFGGEADPNNSAYDEHFITDTEYGVALPFRFEGDRPKVLVENVLNGARAVCTIVDVGPWVTDDNYWEKGTRPLAENCYENDEPIPYGPNEGEMSNGAGIDLTPGAARAIGIEGKGAVHWAFIRGSLQGKPPPSQS